MQKAWGIMDKEDVQPRCSSDECTNQVKIGGVGVCIGIGMEQKSNDAAARVHIWSVIGGVCMRQGAKSKMKRKPKPQAQGTMNDDDDDVLITSNAKEEYAYGYGAKVKLCNYEGCTNQAQ